jgi:hypothetical protein
VAAPSLAAARTRTFRTRRPSANGSIPSMASRPPRGVSRTASVMPPVSIRQAASDALTEPDT